MTDIIFEALNGALLYFLYVETKSSVCMITNVIMMGIFSVSQVKFPLPSVYLLCFIQYDE